MRWPTCCRAYHLPLYGCAVLCCLPLLHTHTHTHTHTRARARANTLAHTQVRPDHQAGGVPQPHRVVSAMSNWIGRFLTYDGRRPSPDFGSFTARTPHVRTHARALAPIPRSRSEASATKTTAPIRPSLSCCCIPPWPLVRRARPLVCKVRLPQRQGLEGKVGRDGVCITAVMPYSPCTVRMGLVPP